MVVGMVNTYEFDLFVLLVVSFVCSNSRSFDWSTFWCTSHQGDDPVAMLALRCHLRCGLLLRHVPYRCSKISSCRRCGLAPINLSTTSPSLMKRNVGIAETEYFAAVSGLSSTSTLTKRASCTSSLNSSNSGAIALQGPHHVAEKSMITSCWLDAAFRTMASTSSNVSATKTSPPRRSSKGANRWAATGPRLAEEMPKTSLVGDAPVALAAQFLLPEGDGVAEAPAASSRQESAR
mmetsp:Transcript_10884/g.30038  ORF Transcript_10884/g.30038 Transcript_10884/m.30038 type:complete len:235 (+) Transcript_10884:801-1505(+)